MTQRRWYQLILHFHITLKLLKHCWTFSPGAETLHMCDQSTLPAHQPPEKYIFCQTKKLGVPQPTLPPPPAQLLETLSILNAVPCIWTTQRWCKCVYLTVSWSLIKKVSNVMFLNLNWKWKYASGLITFQLMNRFLQLNQSSSDLWFYPRPGRICWTQF